MNDLQVFQNEQFGEVRTVLQDGQPWFVALDVCNALGIKNNRDALTRLDEDEKGVGLTDTNGGRQEVVIINEPGLYSLVLRSRKPEAKAFKRWITHEVIPSIRRTGSYGVPNGLADTIIKLADCVNNLSRRIEALESKPQALPAPAIDVMDRKRWMRLVNKKLDVIVEITDFSRNEILSMAYAYVEQAYEIDLNEERLKYMDRTGSDGTVIETIYADKDYKDAFETALNYYLPPTCHNW